MPIIEPFDDAAVPRAGVAVMRAMAAGAVIAVPTETYYGLAVNPFDAGAVDRLCRVKGRPDGKPLLILIGERAQLSRVTTSVPPAAEVLMQAWWPGPLTIVFNASPGLPPGITAGTGTVGVRLTGHPALRTLLAAAGPLTGTSANRSGASPPRTAQEVLEMLGEEVDVILDGGRTPGGLPSTVVDARDTVRVLREGAISRQMLMNVLETQGISVESLRI